MPFWLQKWHACSLLKLCYLGERICVKQIHWDCRGRSGAAEKHCLVFKPGSWPSIILTKEMREHFSHLHLQPLGLNLVRREFCQKTDTSTDYAVTFSAWWKSTSLCAELHPWKEFSEAAICRGIDALCLLGNCFLPDLPLRWFPGWRAGQLAVASLHSNFISRELTGQGQAWLTPISLWSSWPGLNPSWSCHLQARWVLSII